MSGSTPPAWLEARMIRCLRSAVKATGTPALRAMVLVPALLTSVLLAAPAHATIVPAPSQIDAKAYRHPDLSIPSLEYPVANLPALGSRALDLVGLGVAGNHGFYDWRAGRWGSLILSQPLVPGDGVGNNLGAA